MDTMPQSQQSAIAIEAHEISELDRLLTERESAATTVENPETPATQGAETEPGDGVEPNPAETPAEPGSDTPAVTQETTKQEKPAVDPNAPKQSKYKSEQERRDTSWKALNAEKEALAREKAELEADKERIRVEKETKLATAPKYTAEDYDSAATDFESKGQFEFAEAAREEARKLRENPPSQQQKQAEHEAKIEVGQRESWAKVKQHAPDAIKPGTPLNKAMIELANSDGDIWELHPNAPEVLLNIAQGRLAAVRVSELEKELTSAKAKIKELTAATTPSAGGSSHIQPAATSFEKMSESEQRAQLMSMAEAADRR